MLAPSFRFRFSSLLSDMSAPGQDASSSSTISAMSPEFEARLLVLMQTALAPVNTRIDGIHSTVTSLSANVFATNSEVESLGKRLNSLAQQVETIQSQQTPLPPSEADSSRPPSKRPSISPSRRRSSPNPASSTSNPSPTPVPTQAARVPPFVDRPVLGVSSPPSRGTALPNTVFVSLKTTKMYTERVRSMVEGMFKHAFPEGPPPAQHPPHARLPLV